jgi:N-methylhydantoinase A
MVEIDGLPVKTSVIDMVTVGAGGGSIVWVDDGDMLRVGPQSAGAKPGPAGYGRGGLLPTITDAHLVRGTLQADALLGGEMHADLDAARSSFETLAAQLSLSIEALADSAIRVAEANIVRAIQRISTERGRDPRQYALVPFGGAGPMVAARLAEELSINTVITPANAGVLSAYGLLVSDYVHFETLTRRLTVTEQGLQDIRHTIADMATKVQQRLEQLGLSAQARLDVVLEMRYVGQAFEIPVALPNDRIMANDTRAADLITTFEDAHQRVFEFGHGVGGQCEVVSFRVSAAIPAPALPAFTVPTIDTTPITQVEILEHGELQTCRRQKRGASQSIDGPALVEDKTSTLFIPAGWRAQLDTADNLILHKGD